MTDGPWANDDEKTFKMYAKFVAGDVATHDVQSALVSYGRLNDLLWPFMNLPMVTRNGLDLSYGDKDCFDPDAGFELEDDKAALVPPSFYKLIRGKMEAAWLHVSVP